MPPALAAQAGAPDQLQPEPVEGLLQQQQQQQQPLAIEDYHCAVCLELLLDPVAGPCGHDFCKSCLEQWRKASCGDGSIRALCCPICRKEMNQNFGVCMRLKGLLEKTFPSETAARRQERQAKTEEVERRIQELNDLARCPAVQQQRTMQAAVRLQQHSSQQPAWPAPLAPAASRPLGLPLPGSSVSSSWDQDIGLQVFDSLMGGSVYSPSMSGYSTQSAMTGVGATPGRHSVSNAVLLNPLPDFASSGALQLLPSGAVTYLPYHTPPRTVPSLVQHTQQARSMTFTPMHQSHQNLAGVAAAAGAAGALPPLPPRRRGHSSTGCSLDAASEHLPVLRPSSTMPTPPASQLVAGCEPQPGGSTPRGRQPSDFLLEHPSGSRHSPCAPDFMRLDMDAAWPLAAPGHIQAGMGLQAAAARAAHGPEDTTPRYTSAAVHPNMVASMPRGPANDVQPQQPHATAASCDTPRMRAGPASNPFAMPSLSSAMTMSVSSPCIGMPTSMAGASSSLGLPSPTPRLSQQQQHVGCAGTQLKRTREADDLSSSPAMQGVAASRPRTAAQRKLLFNPAHPVLVQPQLAECLVPAGAVLQQQELEEEEMEGMAQREASFGGFLSPSARRGGATAACQMFQRSQTHELGGMMMGQAAAAAASEATGSTATGLRFGAGPFSGGSAADVEPCMINMGLSMALGSNSGRSISSDWLHRMDTSSGGGGGAAAACARTSVLLGGSPNMVTRAGPGMPGSSPPSSVSLHAMGPSMTASAPSSQGIEMPWLVASEPCLLAPSAFGMPDGMVLMGSPAAAAARERGLGHVSLSDQLGLAGLPQVHALSLHARPPAASSGLPLRDTTNCMGMEYSPATTTKVGEQGDTSRASTDVLTAALEEEARTPGWASRSNNMFSAPLRSVVAPTPTPEANTAATPRPPGAAAVPPSPRRLSGSASGSLLSAEFLMPPPPPMPRNRGFPQRSVSGLPRTAGPNPHSLPSILQLASPLRTVRRSMSALESTGPATADRSSMMAAAGLHQQPPPETPRACQVVPPSPFTPHPTHTTSTPAPSRAPSMSGSLPLHVGMPMGPPPAPFMLGPMSTGALPSMAAGYAAVPVAASVPELGHDPRVAAQLQRLVERRSSAAPGQRSGPPLPSQPWHNREQDHTLRMSCTSALLPVFEKRYEELVAQGNTHHPRGAVFLYIAAIEEYLYHTTPSREEYGNLCTLHARMVQAVDALIRPEQQPPAVPADAAAAASPTGSSP